MIHLLSISNQHGFDLRFAHSSFPWSKRVCSMPPHTLPLGLKIAFKNPRFVTCDHTAKEILLISNSVKKIKTLVSYECPSVQLRGSSAPFWHIPFTCENVQSKFDELFKFNCSLNIINVKRLSDPTKVFARSMFSSVFRS
ncbi:hypothetical protein TNCV_3581301 [Trichonephila clavipes]|nr:hypothetical protein TNCV_3581301 [Trichonephila clavipes]